MERKWASSSMVNIPGPSSIGSGNKRSCAMYDAKLASCVNLFIASSIACPHTPQAFLLLRMLQSCRPSHKRLKKLISFLDQSQRKRNSARLRRPHNNNFSLQVLHWLAHHSCPFSNLFSSFKKHGNASPVTSYEIDSTRSSYSHIDYFYMENLICIWCTLM